MWLLTLILIAAALAWYLNDSLRSREVVMRRVGHACRQAGVLLLDQTVVCVRTRPARDENGRLRLRRHYRFEYTLEGDERLTGSATLLGQRVELIALGKR